MTEKTFLGIDQGSSGTKACLIDQYGKQIFQSVIPVSIHKEGAEIVEQDPEELLQSVKDVFRQAKEYAAKNKLNLSAFGLATQRSGVCCWQKTGKVLHPLISWADTRTRPAIQGLKEHTVISDKTGLPVSPHFAAGKIALLQKSFPEQNSLIGTLDTYLMNCLSDGKEFITEDSMAARTMLYDLEMHKWDKELCQLFKVEESRLAKLNPSLYTHVEYHGVKCLAMLGDQQAALFTSKLRGEKAVLNLGSIASLAVCSGQSIVKGKGYVTSVHFSEVDSTFNYIVESITNASGAVIDKIINEWGYAKDLEEIERICKQAAGAKPNSEQHAFLSREGSGLTADGCPLSNVFTNNPLADLQQTVRAAIENIANLVIGNIYQLKEKCEFEFLQSEIVVTGGLSKLNYLLQYIADCTGLILRRPHLSEATAQGVALAAIRTYGVLSIEKLEKPAEDKFAPRGRMYSDLAAKRYQDWISLKEKVEKKELATLHLI